MKRTKRPRVLLAGTFDIIHPGHLSLFEQAKRYGEVTVIVARDANVIKDKGRQPYYDERTRVKTLKSIPGIHAILGNKEDKFASIFKAKPDIIALGYDQQVDVSKLTMFLKTHGLKARIIRLKPYKPRSFKSSKLRP